MTGIKNALEGDHWKGLTPVLLLLLSVTIGIATTLGSFVLNSVVQNVEANAHEIRKVVDALNIVDKRVALMEGTTIRFQELNTILNEMNKKADKSEVPPAWFRSQVDKNTTDIETLKKALANG